MYSLVSQTLIIQDLLSVEVPSASSFVDIISYDQTKVLTFVIFTDNFEIFIIELSELKNLNGE